MAKLYLIAGTKGGVGKTLIATLLCDFAVEANRRVVLFDCDDENNSLRNSYPGENPNMVIESVALDTNTSEKEYPLDDIVNRTMKYEREKMPPGSPETVYIVDMKAGTSFRTINWMAMFPFDLFRENGIDVVLTGVVTSDIDSVLTFAVWVKKYFPLAQKEMLKFIVVKNGFLGGAFDFYDAKVKKIMEQIPGTVTLALPNLGAWYLKTIRGCNTTFGNIAISKTDIPDFDIMDMIRIGMLYDELKKNFAPLFPITEKKEKPRGGEK